MEETSIKHKMKYRRGDKVVYRNSEDEVGTVRKSLGNNRYLVDFFIPGRKKNGYHIELELESTDLRPYYIDVR